MSTIPTYITSVFPKLTWAKTERGYKAPLPNGYMEVTESNRMDGRHSGEIAFYVLAPNKRQIFSFG